MPDEFLTVAPKLPVEEILPLAQKLIARRRHKWKMTTLAWEDVAQRLLIRIWQQYHLYNPAKAPLENWMNFLISNEWKNILRNILFKHAPPCIGKGGCSFNQGGDACGYTPSGLKCGECPLYANWQEKKENEHNITATLSLGAHAQEVDNIQSDFMDMAGAKRKIDEIMLRRLNPFTGRIYRMLLIQHMTPREVSNKLKIVYKTRKLKEGEGVGYQSILATLSILKVMVKRIIAEEGLAE